MRRFPFRRARDNFVEVLEDLFLCWQIVGADNDWVEIEFKTLPKNLAVFAEEIYDFCPDAVDQGPGNISGLVKEMQATRRLFLWWD